MDNQQVLQFPQGFLWGSATAAHQVEGNNTYNDWYEFEKQGHVVNKEVSGIACDHYNRYEEDLDLAAQLGHSAYRFSIEWSRIEPVEGQFDLEQLNHYYNVIQAAKKRGMKVFVTLFHVTSPLWFSKKGGWEQKDAIKIFIRYVEYIVTHLGNEIDFWITINEPITYATSGYYLGVFPPKKKKLYLAWKMFNKLLDAHNEAYFTIHRYLKDAKVSFSKLMLNFEPYRIGNFIDSLLSTTANKLFNMHAFKKTLGSLDYLAIQHYHTIRLKFKPGGRYFLLLDEFGLLNPDNEANNKSDIGWSIKPEGMYRILVQLKQYNLPINITENGIADAKDSLRAKYIQDILSSVHRAISDGIDVRGYLHWSLLDNFEWEKGFFPRFGLVEIDYQNNLQRKIRQSGHYFGRICRENQLIRIDQ